MGRHWDVVMLLERHHLGCIVLTLSRKGVILHIIDGDVPPPCLTAPDVSPHAVPRCRLKHLLLPHPFIAVIIFRIQT